MRPAFSVIVFTVLSGAGLGLLALVVPLELLGLIDPALAVIAGVWAAVLLAAGLFSSSLHLANARNAWRAFSQWRRSWLSREAVAAAALQPAVGVWLAALWWDASWPWRAAAGFAVLLLAWTVLVCTGMIYACLKTVPRWCTPLTPLAYLVLGHASGAVLLVAIAAAAGRATTVFAGLAILLLAAALVVKVLWLRHAHRVDGRLRIERALPLSASRIGLLDRGHTHDNFLTREFGFQVAPARAALLRTLALAGALLIPALLLGWAPGGAVAPAIAALCCLAGLLVERWLFFAESGHVVRLYFGQPAV